MKRRNAGLCAAILLLTTLTSNVPAMDTFAADRSADVRKLRDFLVCKGELTADEAAQFDMNSDGKLNAVDLTLMKRDCLYPSEPDPVISAGTYEAESAYLTGGNKISEDSGASGGKAVGSFADDTDTVKFTIQVPADGIYKLILTSKGMGGSKVNNVFADGESVGTFESNDSGYTDAVLKGVMMKAGKHEITVTKSWGWIMLDKLTVETDAGISNDVYIVSNQLINPNADAAAQELFNYLCESYGKHTLAGQVCDYGLDGPEFKAIHDVTGKYPAICGLDFMDYAPSRAARGAKGFSTDTALKIHDAGGIVTFCWHWNAPDKYLKDGNDYYGNPRWWQGFSTSNVTIDIDAIMNGRDNEGKALLDKDIEAIAKQINILRDAGVPILWRPLHEASGGWFWWGAKGAEAYKKFWKYLFDQFSNKYGCSNLIWVWNGQAADWYPGDEYVDIIGEDIYAGEHSYGAQNAKFADLLEYPGTNKITALTENGTVFDIDNVFATNARWAWFGTWCGDFVTNGNGYNEQYTEKYILKKAYDSDYVITLDELPQWTKKSSNPGKQDPPQSDTKRTSYPDNGFQWVNQDYLNNQWAPLGKVERFNYQTRDHSSNDQKTYYKSALVYLPADYNSSRQYNVLYLMHGGSDSPEWFFGGEGKSSQITRMLDSMTAAGDIAPTIVCAVSYYTEYRSDDTGNCLNFWRELMNDVMPEFEKKYSTYTNGNTSSESLAASRMHRAFGGFSMGSVTTWAVFEHCLNEIAYYMPISGDCWALGGTAGGSQADGTAWHLAEAVRNQGKSAKDFYIYSGCGEWDIAQPNLTPQIQAMAKHGDPFIWCDNFANGNLYQCQNPGGGHDVNTVTAVMYNALPKLFG